MDKESNPTSKTGRTGWDFLAERWWIAILLISLFAFIFSGVVYLISSKNIQFVGKDFSLTVGMIDTIGQTQGAAKTLNQLVTDLANHTNDPVLKDQFLEIAQKTKEMISRNEGLKSRLTALANNPDPKLQEKLIKEMLSDYGLSQEMVNKIGLGIVSKYEENDSLKKELGERLAEIMRKDRELQGKDARIAQLEADKRNLQSKLQEMLAKMQADSLNNLSTKDDHRIIDSLNRVLFKLDSSDKAKGDKLSKLLPFSVQSLSVGLENVGKRKSGEYKVIQLRGHDKEIQLILDTKVNPSYEGKDIAPYIIDIEIVYQAKGKSPTQKFSTSISILPGQKFEKPIALKAPITQGQVFITFSYKGTTIWNENFAVGQQ